VPVLVRRLFFHSENRRLIEVLFGASQHAVAGYIEPYPLSCFIFFLQYGMALPCDVANIACGWAPDLQ
jgi:hypothetical protein